MPRLTSVKSVHQRCLLPRCHLVNLALFGAVFSFVEWGCKKYYTAVFLNLIQTLNFNSNSCQTLLLAIKLNNKFRSQSGTLSSGCYLSRLSWNRRFLAAVCRFCKFAFLVSDWSNADLVYLISLDVAVQKTALRLWTNVLYPGCRWILNGEGGWADGRWFDILDIFTVLSTNLAPRALSYPSLRSALGMRLAFKMTESSRRSPL